MAQNAPRAAPVEQPVQSRQPATIQNPAPRSGAPAQAIARSNATDAARYLAGLPVSEQSPLSGWTRDPRWIAHSNAMNNAFATLEQRQLNNIRIWRAELLAPATQSSRNCLYLFSGPDFLYADAFFPDCTNYVLQGLETIEPMPDLATVPQAVLLSTLQNIEASLNSVLNFSFFITKDMRQDFQRSPLRGTLPIIFVFLARTGKELTSVSYVSLGKDGRVIEGPGGGTRGVRIAFVDPGNGAHKTLYYFTADLSDDAIRSNPGFLRFCAGLAPTNSLLKAASYLMFQSNFNAVRDLILRSSSTILEDDSGVPIQYFTRDRWTLRFFGTYTKPIDLFKQYYQPVLQQYFAGSAPRPLTFGFGYQWNRHSSGMILATRK